MSLSLLHPHFLPLLQHGIPPMGCYHYRLQLFKALLQNGSISWDRNRPLQYFCLPLPTIKILLYKFNARSSLDTIHVCDHISLIQSFDMALSDLSCIFLSKITYVIFWWSDNFCFHIYLLILCTEIVNVSNFSCVMYLSRNLEKYVNLNSPLFLSKFLLFPFLWCLLNCNWDLGKSFSRNVFISY